MHGEQIEAVSAENLEQFLKTMGILEAEPGLHGERNGDRFPQGRQDAMDALRIAQQTAARAFAIHDRGRATEVEINCRDRVSLQLFGPFDQTRNVVAHELSDDRAARRILRDRRKDVGIEMRVGMDAEILRHVEIGAIVSRHELPEREIRHVLHGSKNEDRFGIAEER